MQPITHARSILLIAAIVPTVANAQIDFVGTIEALTQSTSEQSTLDTSSGILKANAYATWNDSFADVRVHAVLGTSSSSLTIVHDLDSGPTPVAGGASVGGIEFFVEEGTYFELTGLLEQMSTNPAGGGSVTIRNEDTFVTWFSAGPNFALPNRPIDFSAIPSGGVLDEGNYKLNWFHAANNTINTSARTTATGDFTLTLTPPSPKCLADLNGDGMLNFFDVSAFLTAFNAMDPSADLNNDGSFDFFDVSVFLTAYAMGCP